MYETFFGLRERPFDLTPNPKYLYLTGRHREALSNLQYGITGRRGITLLIGEAGTGKTTLVRAAIGAIAGAMVRCVYVSNPVLTRGEFYELLAAKFGLSDRAAASKARFLYELEETLAARQAAGATLALIIDEAQSLPPELMEEVRLLANVETPTEKLLPVVLAGQPELAARLEQERFRQLKQRVALRCELAPLDMRETAAYIAGRISIAGGEAAQIFTREAARLVYERSRGIPRTISVICDNALLTAFAAGLRPVTSDVVLEVCRDFNIAPKPDERAGLPSSEAPPAVGGSAAGGSAPGVVAVAGPSQVRQAPAAPGNGHKPVPNVAPPAVQNAGQTAAIVDAAAGQAAAMPPGVEGRPATGDELFGMFTKKKRFRFF